MYSTIEKSILQMLMYPNVRDLAMGYVEDWMFSSDALVGLCNVLKRLPTHYNDIPDPNEVVLTLHNDHRIPEQDCEIAYLIVTGARDTPHINLENSIHHITEFVRERIMARGVEKLSTGDSANERHKGREMLQHALNLSISSDHFYDFSQDEAVRTAKDLDLPPGGIIIKSHYELVNRSSLYGGYKYSDLVMHMARPGTGKSTSIVCEGAMCVAQGFRTCHLFLGDMTEYDAFLKYLSYWVGVSTDDIVKHGHERYMTPSIVEMFSRLRVKALPADTHDVYAVIAKANQIRRSFPFDTLCVDYDANIKSLGDMYSDAGHTYANLKSYGQNKCVVHVGSQTKPAFWDMEIVPLDAPAESSKKPHHVDMAIGIGRNKMCKRLGTLNIAKMRRGISEVQTRLDLDYAFTRMREITQARYDEILDDHRRQAEGEEAPAILDPAPTGPSVV